MADYEVEQIQPRLRATLDPEVEVEIEQPSVADIPQVYKVVIESTSSYEDGAHAEGVWNGSYESSGAMSHTAKLIGPDGKVIFTRTWDTQ